MQLVYTLRGEEFQKAVLSPEEAHELFAAIPTDTSNVLYASLF
jgi:hypothetical protein